MKSHRLVVYSQRTGAAYVNRWVVEVDVFDLDKPCPIHVLACVDQCPLLLDRLAEEVQRLAEVGSARVVHPDEQVDSSRLIGDVDERFKVVDCEFA